MVAGLVRNYVEHMWLDGGVIRASLLHVRTGEDWWAAFRELGAWMPFCSDGGLETTWPRSASAKSVNANHPHP